MWTSIKKVSKVRTYAAGFETLFTGIKPIKETDFHSKGVKTASETDKAAYICIKKNAKKSG